jgi:hypothetical protein
VLSDPEPDVRTRTNAKAIDIITVSLTLCITREPLSANRDDVTLGTHSVVLVFAAIAFASSAGNWLRRPFGLQNDDECFKIGDQIRVKMRLQRLMVRHLGNPLGRYSIFMYRSPASSSVSM